MKTKNIYLSLLMLAFIGILGSSCSSSLKPLTPSHFNVTPSPLETVGNEIPATVNGVFPEKWFNSHATIVVTPVLKYAGQEAYGIPYTYQGDKVAGNGIVINKNRGGNVAMNFKFEYEPAMRESELFLRFNAKIKGKQVKLPEIKIADGVVATSALASALSTEPSDAQDAFQRIIQQKQDANILFLIQQADLRSSELNKSELAAWKRRVKEAYTDPKQNVDIEVSAYASPDGGLTLNEKLAAEREKRTSTYLDSEMKKQAVNTDINARYTAQDWEGFRQLVEASNLQDKDLVLRVLSMYEDPEVREKEIKNMSTAFEALKDEILPKLRRSKMMVNVDTIGRTDAQILAQMRSDAKVLSLEEMLYAATLTEDVNEQLKFYQVTADNYPKCLRAHNNVAYTLLSQGKVDEALASLEKAVAIQNNDVVKNNMAFAYLLNGEIAKAEETFNSMTAATDESKWGLGVIALTRGEYDKAVNFFGTEPCFNLALAQLLKGDVNQAKATLDKMTESCASGKPSYLRAVVGARLDDKTYMLNGLREAFAANANWKAYASTDMEFAKYFADDAFKAAVQ